jgi:hypothetical protein
MLCRSSSFLLQAPTIIHAELFGDDCCSALGLDVRAAAPVLTVCRTLVEAGHDPATPLEAFRGPTLCLRIRSIGEAAGLEINANGTGFRRRRATDAASPMRKSGPAGTGHRPHGGGTP